eukprot:360861-Chlamydomonas_euryale.AAC.4
MSHLRVQPILTISASRSADGMSLLGSFVWHGWMLDGRKVPVADSPLFAKTLYMKSTLSCLYICRRTRAKQLGGQCRQDACSWIAHNSVGCATKMCLYNGAACMCRLDSIYALLGLHCVVSQGYVKAACSTLKALLGHRHF